jgi:hypothetical protein
MAVSQENLARRCITVLKAQPRKTALLVALLLVMVAMWARHLNSGILAPPATLANVLKMPPEPQRPAPPITVLQDAGRTTLRDWLRQPIGDPGRNLFAVRYDYYPRDDSRVSTVANLGTGGFWGELAKSLSNQADQVKEKQILRENMIAKASALKLQSTVMGKVPKALVDGELVGEGDVVAGFRVLKIGSRGIVVEQEGIRLEIQMR